MSQPYKICPICETPNHRSAALCRTCGSSLAGVEVVIPENVKEQPATGYAYQFGETDLLEGGLIWKGGTYILVGVLALALILCAGILIIAMLPVVNQMIPSPAPTSSGLTAPGNPAGNSPIFATATPFPTLFLATVTPAPPTRTPMPTATPTETPSPCMQQVLPGDNLIAIVYRCGHRSLDVIDLVLEINNLTDASRIQEGQVLEIPWPTPTLDPNALPTESPTESAGGPGINIAGSSADTINASTQPRGLGPRPTETLPPGVTWHQVQKDENIIIIAYNYGANVKILSDLNPEITFSQCDFGLDAGGPNCIVQLYEGQLVRVPAPTPTPTLSPTPSGSETPTPTATPTFNAPSPLSPDNRVFFGNGEFVTLRWVASGTLGVAQSYAVRVEDLTTGNRYTANTQELFFILPQDWQGTDDQRHEYSWTVSVIDNDNPENPYFTTQPRTFVWEGRGA
ncbi:MAG: hypothetical protein H6672_10555 [Anaerolineaceae bacterium]|nr:hypothetical protein [Anaerolineaceae bacterium]